MYVDWYVFEEEWYGKAMLGTLPYPRTPRTHPAPHHFTQPLPPTLPYKYHPTQPLPYSCPAIHRLALLYHTLPYPSAVYEVRSDVSVVLLSISASESGLVLSLRSVSFQSVKLKAIGTDRMNSVKSVDSMPELS